MDNEWTYDLYKTNKDFKEYVDRVCTNEKERLEIFEALRLKTAQEVENAILNGTMAGNDYYYDLYKSNKDFKEYVDRVCTKGKERLGVFEALRLKTVQEVGDEYANKG